MRILHLLARSQRRGAETAALELAEELESRGHENRIVALAPAFDGSRDPAVATLGHRREGPLAIASGTWALRRALAREPTDVVLAHGGQPAQVAALATRRGHPRVVWQRILGFPSGFWGQPRSSDAAGSRGPSGFWRSRRRRWWQWVVRRIDAVVALTPELAEEVEQLGFPGPVWVIGNSRRPERFLAVDRASARARLRDELGIADDVPLVGLVGHLVDQKRPERAVAVLDEVRRGGPPAHLVLAGSGPLRGAVADEVTRRGLDEHVTFLGERTDVEWILAGLDVLLLTSDAEGIPGIVIEAQMAGCPVVTFPLGGVDSVVIDKSTGVVLARADVSEMASETTRLLVDPECRSGMAEAARARAPELSTSRAAKVYEARFRELLDGAANVRR